MSLPAPPVEAPQRAPPFDALLSARRFLAKDFEYYEDGLKRWAAVAVFGAIYLALALFILDSFGGYLGFDGVSLIILGVVLVVIVTPILFTFVSGETAFATLFAGFTAGAVGLSIIANWNGSMLGTFLYFAVIGVATFALGFTMWRATRATLRAVGDY